MEDSEVQEFYIRRYGVNQRKREITVTLKFPIDLDLTDEDARIHYLETLNDTLRKQQTKVINIE